MKLAFATALCLITTAGAHAFEQGVWKSDYSSGHNTYTLQTFENDTFTLTIGPNMFGFDRLGELSVSTKMGTQGIEGKMSIDPVSVPRDTLVYRLEGTIDLEIVDKAKNRAEGFVRLIKLNDKIAPVVESVRLFRQ